MTMSKFLTLIVLLQVLILTGQWAGPSLVAPAQAQIPDAGAQRIMMIDELKLMNAKMDKVIQVLEAGKFQVTIVKEDEKKQ
jgi:hypothetical protein